MLDLTKSEWKIVWKMLEDIQDIARWKLTEDRYPDGSHFRDIESGMFGLTGEHRTVIGCVHLYRNSGDKIVPPVKMGLVNRICPRIWNGGKRKIFKTLAPNHWILFHIKSITIIKRKYYIAGQLQNIIIPKLWPLINDRLLAYVSKFTKKIN